MQALPPSHIRILRHDQRLLGNGADRSQFFDVPGVDPG
jgi:hypothetical protein